MSPTRWHRRFYASTRGRIVALLRRGSRTVEELSAELKLTDNAVRAHLTGLERDGLVRQSGFRPGVRKPSYIYELTQEAERLFPKAYGTVLRELLDVLAERMRPDDVTGILREVGRRLGAGRGVRGDDLRGRLRGAVKVIGELGGLAELEQSGGFYAIRGYGCPLSAVVSQHPEVCVLTEALLEELVGAEVRERCQRGERPRCYFEVAPGGEGAPERPPKGR